MVPDGSCRRGAVVVVSLEYIARRAILSIDNPKKVEIGPKEGAGPGVLRPCLLLVWALFVATRLVRCNQRNNASLHSCR